MIKDSGGWNKGKNNPKYRHGLTNHRIYKIWTDMKKRCLNTKNKRYENYGGKGVKICNEWLDDFQKFYNWSMENGYMANLSIDRMDVNGNYEPSNCKWSTPKEQARNTTRNHFVDAFGETKTIAEWSELSGLSQNLIKDRINKLNWNPERAVSEKVRVCIR